MNDSDFRWLLPLLLAVVAGAGIWFFVLDGELPTKTRTEPPLPVPPTAEPAERLGPIHPLPPTDDKTVGDRLVPLPPLEDSDAYFKLALVDVFGPGADGLLVEEALIEKFVTTIDNLPRRHVSEKIRPVGAVARQFRAETGDDEQPVELSPENYSRYDGIVNTIVAADDDELVDVYRRFYPLFQEAYEGLGYPDSYFNDRAVEVIDHLLAAPQPEPPIYVKRANVLYEFADPDLEALSAGEKLLIRIGNDNADKVKARLRTLRAIISNTPAE